MSLVRHAGYKFPFRHPAPEGLLEKSLYALGGLFRGTGTALDELGTFLMGPAGKIEEKVNPNLAWAPMKPDHDPTFKPKFGQLAPAPAMYLPHPIKEIVMPVKGEGVFIAPNAQVLGDVKIGDRSSIWYGAVLRGDVNGIKVGNNTNIQDNVVVHVARYSVNRNVVPTVIGNNVTVGHGAVVHAATVGDNCLVGMGSTLLDGVVMEPNSIVAAGSVVPPGTTIPSGQVWAGSPAKYLRDLSIEEQEFVATSAVNYIAVADAHKFENSKSFEEQEVEELIVRERFEASDPINTAHQMWIFDSQTMLVTRPKK